MSRTYKHAAPETHTDATIRRGQRKGHPPIRRTGTRAAVIAAALAEYR